MTKAFILTVIIQVLRKNIIFQEHKICTFREILIFQSHSTDGKRSKFFSLKNANFLRRFYISTNDPLKNLDIFLRAIHYMTKAFTLTVIIQVLKKKSPIFRKPNFCTFREILIF